MPWTVLRLPKNAHATATAPNARPRLYQCRRTNFITLSACLHGRVASFKIYPAGNKTQPSTDLESGRALPEVSMEVLQKVFGFVLCIPHLEHANVARGSRVPVRRGTSIGRCKAARRTICAT